MEKFIFNHIQNIFGCSSANFHKYPEIWMKNIELFIPQIYNLIIILNPNYKSNILQMEQIDYNNDLSLKNLFDSYGSDKGGIYYPFYTNILNKYKNDNIRLLEIGLGTNDVNLISTMGNSGSYKCGGSVRAFKEYLPNAFIYGADVDKKCLFNEARISTFFVDQLNMSTFDTLYKNCGDLSFDIIIDDGLHSIGANLNTILFSLQHINKNGIIIIEDIPTTKMEGYQIIDFIIKQKEETYNTYFVQYNDNKGFLYVIEKI